MNLSDDILQDLYCWVDQIPLSRPKRNIGRDFSDGVAEIVQHFYPRLVDMHNYTPTNAVARKAYNWATLNKRVFRSMGFGINPGDVEAVVNVRRIAIERVLITIRQKRQMGEYDARRLKRKSQQKTPQITKETPKELQFQESEPEPAIVQMCSEDRATEPGSATESGSAPVVHDDLDKRNLLREKELLLARSQQNIEILNAKVEKLEQLLALKNDRIIALTQNLEQFHPH